MKSYNPILFDLDGTLTDPGEGIRNSVAHALQYYGIQMSTAELNRFIGPPLAEGFREFCGFSAGQAAEAVEHYREYYREKGMLENRVYDGIPELLAHLRGRGRFWLWLPPNRRCLPARSCTIMGWTAISR